MIRYIELKTGYSDDGPAWIARVTPSKTARTIYFNGRALEKLKGAERFDGGNYVDWETREAFWVSGVKKNGKDRHRFGSGKVLIEATVLSDYLEIIGAGDLDKRRYETTNSIVPTDIRKFERLADRSRKDTGVVSTDRDDMRRNLEQLDPTN